MTKAALGAGLPRFNPKPSFADAMANARLAIRDIDLAEYNRDGEIDRILVDAETTAIIDVLSFPVDNPADILAKVRLIQDRNALDWNERLDMLNWIARDLELANSAPSVKSANSS